MQGPACAAQRVKVPPGKMVGDEEVELWRECYEGRLRLRSCHRVFDCVWNPIADVEIAWRRLFRDGLVDST